MVCGDQKQQQPVEDFEDGWMDGTEDGLASSSKSRMASPPDHHHHQQQQSLAWTAEDIVSICKPLYCWMIENE